MHEMEGLRPVSRYKAIGCPNAMRCSTYYQGQ
jgi:hypothetical protein